LELIVYVNPEIMTRIVLGKSFTGHLDKHGTFTHAVHVPARRIGKVFPSNHVGVKPDDSAESMTTYFAEGKPQGVDDYVIEDVIKIKANGVSAQELVKILTDINQNIMSGRNTAVIMVSEPKQEQMAETIKPASMSPIKASKLGTGGITPKVASGITGIIGSGNKPSGIESIARELGKTLMPKHNKNKN
jgi:hypothetical protein